MPGLNCAQPSKRARNSFLGLAALVSVMLAGAAIAVASRRYSQKTPGTQRLLMRCFGADQRTVTHVFGLQILLIGPTRPVVVGCLLGYGFQWLLIGGL